MDERTSLLQESPNVKKPSPWYAIFPMLLVAFSGGALFAPHVQFYTEIFCSRYCKSQNDTEDTLVLVHDCAIPQVQKMVSRAQAIIMFLTYASTLILAGYYGKLSDYKGRRVVLRISTLGSLFYVTCDLITAKYYDTTLGISLLFVGPLLRGIMAGESVLMAAVQAYIADSTLPSSRTVVFARLMACLFIGSAIGPFVSSLILKHTGSIINVFYIAFFVDFINVIYTHFFLPESNSFAATNKSTTPLNTETDKATRFWERLNIFSSLDILFKSKTSSYMTVYALFFIALAEFLLTLVKRPPILLYAMLKFKWTAYEGSIYFACTSTMKLFIMVGILPLLSKIYVSRKRLTSPDKANHATHPAMFDIWMIRIGIGIDAVCLALSGFATNAVVFSMAGILQSFSMLAQPSIRGLLTMLVKPNEVGRLLGAIAVLDSLAMILSHLGINALYGATVATMPNLTFFVCACIAGCSCLSAFLVQKRKNSDVTENDGLVPGESVVAVLDRTLSDASIA